MNSDRQVTDFYVHKCISTMKEIYQEKWNILANHAKDKLDKSNIQNKRAYTPHDFTSHCFDIYSAVSLCILRDTAYETLPDEAIFLLNAAILFHDIKMPDSLSDPERNKHARLSAEWVKKDNICRKYLGKRGVEMCAKIIIAHSDEKKEVNGITKITKSLADFQFENKKGDSGEEIPIKFLAGVLRLADELDVTYDRMYRYEIYEVNKIKLNKGESKASLNESKQHWHSLRYFSDISLDNGVIKLSVNYKEYEKDPEKVSYHIRKIVHKIKKEMNNIFTYCFNGYYDFINCGRKEIEVDFGSAVNGVGKEVFPRREALFYRKIAPFILNTYLLSEYRYIYEKLPKIELEKNNIILPYIDLIANQEHIKVLPDIDTSVLRGLDTKDEIYYDRNLIALKEKEVAIVGGEMFNGDKFMVERIESEGRLQMSRADYYHILSSADGYRERLIRNFPQSWFYKEIKLEDFEADEIKNMVKPWFDLVGKVINENDYTGFCAGIGISTLVIFKSNGEYQYLLMKGSNKKATGKKMNHVVPSSMFEEGRTERSEYDKKVRLQILREFGEEVLCIEELRNMLCAKELEQYCKKYWQYEYVFRNIHFDSDELNYDIHIKNKEMELYQTGFVLDIWHMRPALTHVLIIHEDNFFDKPGDSLNMKTFEGKATAHPLNDEKEYQKLLVENFVPEGLAALRYGREYALNNFN